jgi:DNA polymerase III epsilon subunit-like protein
MSGRPGNGITGRSHTTMDMRTIEKIEYGSASAVRVPPDAISNLGMPDRFIAFDTETTGLNPDKDCPEGACAEKERCRIYCIALGIDLR